MESFIVYCLGASHRALSWAHMQTSNSNVFILEHFVQVTVGPEPIQGKGIVIGVCPTTFAVSPRENLGSLRIMTGAAQYDDDCWSTLL